MVGTFVRGLIRKERIDALISSINVNRMDGDNHFTAMKDAKLNRR
jgi:hypothetical protein